MWHFFECLVNHADSVGHHVKEFAYHYACVMFVSTKRIPMDLHVSVKYLPEAES